LITKTNLHLKFYNIFKSVCARQVLAWAVGVCGRDNVGVK